MSDEIKKEDQEVKEEKCCCGCDEAKEAPAKDEEKACDCKESCDCEKAEGEKTEEAPAAAKKVDSKGVALAKAALRVIVLVVIIALIGFFFMRDPIMQKWYGNRDSGTIRAMIEKKIADDFGDKVEYEITYFDEGEGANQGYTVIIKKGKIDREFQFYGDWDANKKEPMIVFVGDGDENNWNTVAGKKKAVKAQAPAEAPAAPAEAPAAPAAQ